MGSMGNETFNGIELEISVESVFSQMVPKNLHHGMKSIGPNLGSKVFSAKARLEFLHAEQ